MRVTALRPLVRGLHTTRAAFNAALSSAAGASPADPAPLAQSDKQVKSEAVEVTESGKRDIETTKGARGHNQKRSTKAPEIELDILTQDTSLLELDSKPRSRQSASKSESGPSRISKPRDRSSTARSGRPERSDRTDRSTRPDRSPRTDRAPQVQQAARQPRAGAAQRAAQRATPRPAPSLSPRDVDMQTDNRPRGKQAVEPVEFDTSFQALFGRESMLGVGAGRSGGRGLVEKSEWALRRGMKPDEARRAEILRAAGAYMTETPTTALPSTLPANTAASQRARAIASWNMAMNPSIGIGAQQQAGKVFDAFLK